MNGKINQTSINSLKLLESQIDVAPLKGTAIFLVPAPDISDTGTRVITVPHLDYNESCRRGQHCLAFKWVAESILSHEDMIKKRLIAPCNQFCAEGLNSCSDQCICDYTLSKCVS